MRRILIPLNISEISPTILPVVRRLFEPTEAELILLGITQRTNDYEFACACGPDGANIGYYVPSPAGEWQAYRQKFEVELKHLAQTLREVGYHVHTLMRNGRAKRHDRLANCPSRLRHTKWSDRIGRPSLRLAQ